MCFVSGKLVNQNLSGRACGRRKKIVVVPSVGIGVLEGRKSARHHRLLFGVVHASATRRFALLCFGSTFVWAVYPTLVAESAGVFSWLIVALAFL